jgi:hypothetical protein
MDSQNLMWWKIIKSIVCHFKTDSALSYVPEDNKKAGIPEREDIPDYPAIRVCRGGESGLDLQSRGKGDVTIWIECWQGSDSQDPGDAYELLEQLEQKMIASLMKWLQVAPAELKIRLSFDITNMSSDGDTFRPVVGSRTTLIVHYYK